MLKIDLGSRMKLVQILFTRELSMGINFRYLYGELL